MLRAGAEWLWDWLLRLLRRLAELTVSTADYEGPWSYGRFGPMPRRRLSDKANFLVGGGMYEAWKDWLVKHGLVAHLCLVRRAFPQELTRTLNQPVRLLTWLLFKRSLRHCPKDTAAVLARSRGRFPQSLTEQHAQLSRSDAWLVHRILNGMFPAYLRRSADSPGACAVEYRWNHLDFKRDTQYTLPSVRARLELHPAGGVQLARLDFRYADEDEIGVVMAGPDRAPDWLCERARRTFRCAYLNAAEIDRHVVLGHLLTEFVLVGLCSELSEEHPVRRLLLPFLRYIDVINHLADKLVWGELGLMVLGSPFRADGLARHLTERMGAFDWKGFAPQRTVIAHGHYAPLVQAEFWQCVVDYVEDASAELQFAELFAADGTMAAHGRGAELRALAHALRDQSVEHKAYDAASEHDFLDPSELCFKSPGKSFSAIETLEDLKQFCRFTIYCATLGHGWANVRQYEEGGEPAYASFGLRLRLDAPAPADPSDDSGWHIAASPCACDQVNQRLQGFVLSHLPVANLTDASRGVPSDGVDGDAMPEGRTLGDHVARRGDVIAQLAQRNATSAPDRECDASRIPIRPNA